MPNNRAYDHALARATVWDAQATLDSALAALADAHRREARHLHALGLTPSAKECEANANAITDELRGLATLATEWPDIIPHPDGDDEDDEE